MQMLCKNFLMSEEFQSPHGHYILKKGLLHVNYVPKRFLVETTWRCTWTLTLGKGLTNADIEEIVTNISPKPQSWRYISFSTAERSPKCNSTQEKSPCEQCVKIVYTRNNIKHTWIFLLCHEMDQCAPSRVFPIETGATIDTSWDQ